MFRYTANTLPLSPLIGVIVTLEDYLKRFFQKSLFTFEARQHPANERTYRVQPLVEEKEES